MKHLVFRWLGLVILLSLSVGLQSCMELIRPRGCEKPDSLIYRYGLLDNIPAGTRAVFESNTGKLDTATYGEIKKDTNIYNIGGQGRCDEQDGIVHSESQSINFNNKFGLSDFTFFRSSNGGEYGGDSLIFLSSYIEFRKDFNSFSSFTESFEILGKRYDDCVSVPFINKDTIFGKLVYSKKNGLIRVNYNSKTFSDTIFSFKHLIF